MNNTTEMPFMHVIKTPVIESDALRAMFALISVLAGGEKPLCMEGVNLLIEVASIRDEKKRNEYAKQLTAFLNCLKERKE